VRLRSDGVGAALFSPVHVSEDVDIMAINFAGVVTTLEATDTEVAEYNLALEALGGAKEALVVAQASANSAQLGVTAATESVSSEKADVVKGIADAITQLNAILSELQE
jgi:hypothetical protein